MEDESGVVVDDSEYEELHDEEDDDEGDLYHVRNLNVENELPEESSPLEPPPAKRRCHADSGVLLERCENRMKMRSRDATVTTVKIEKGRVQKEAGEIKLLQADVVDSPMAVFPKDRHMAYKRTDEGAAAASFSTRKLSYGSLRMAKVSEYDPRRPSPFDGLADEVIVKILEYLPRFTLVSCARTCKRMRAISYDEALWKRVDLGGKQLPSGVVGRIVSRGTQVLRMAKVKVNRPVFEGGAVVQLPKLQYLDLSQASISAECLFALIAACGNLTKLGLEQCALTEDVCEAVSRNSSLRTLHLGMTSGLTAGGLSRLARLTSLQELNLGWVGMTEEMLVALRQLLAANAASLLKLNVAGCKENLSDGCMTFVLETCPNLNELDISDARRLTADTIGSIVGFGGNLESLGVSRCYGIPPRAFVELTGCMALKEFTCYGILKDEAIEELKARLHPIKVNKNFISYIARPTVGIKRTSIWNMRTREANPK